MVKINDVKFRMWNRSDQTMTYFPLGELLNNYADECNFLDIIDEPLYAFAHYEDGEHLELMQYTGLQDKHGKDIYEGDIIRINHPADRTGDFTNMLGEVFWWKEEGGWYHSNQGGRPPKRMWEYTEIMGNIYEHPDLIPVEK